MSLSYTINSTNGVGVSKYGFFYRFYTLQTRTYTVTVDVTLNSGDSAVLVAENDNGSVNAIPSLGNSVSTGGILNKSVTFTGLGDNTNIGFKYNDINTSYQTEVRAFSVVDNTTNLTYSFSYTE